jgi:hypothetical protein
MSAATLVPSLMPLLMVVAMRRAEARIYRQLADAQALSAESAIQLPLQRSFDRRRLEGLVKGGAVRPAADSRHFLDPEGWERYQRTRRRRGLIALAIVVALVCAVLAVAYAMR